MNSSIVLTGLRFKCLVVLFTLFCGSVAIGIQAQASTVTVAPTAGHPGLSITVSASAFGASEAVDVYFDTVDTMLLVTTAMGTFTGSLTLPAGASPGTHYVTAIGRHSGDAAQIAVKVSTSWIERGFGAANMGWNPYENSINTSNVNQLGLLWSAPTELNGGGVAIVGGRVISAGSPGGVQSRATTTGALQWSALPTGYFASGPAVSGGLVYVAGDPGSGSALTALKLATGAVSWTQALPSSSESSPVVVNGIVYVGCDDEKVYAFNAASGAPLWTFLTSAPVVFSPVPVNGILYVVSSGNLYALSASTGTLEWQGSLNTQPVVASGRVFGGFDPTTLYIYQAYSGILLVSNDPAGNQNAFAAANGVLYALCDHYVRAISEKNGGIIWSVDVGETFTAGEEPIIANGVLYAGSASGTLHAFDVIDGTELYTASGLNSILSASVSDGVLYFSDNVNTYAYALKASVDAGKRRINDRPKSASLVPDLTLQITASLSPTEAKTLIESEE